MIKTLSKIALSIVVILAPAKSIIIATFVLIVFDFITGILAARKRGEQITSSGMRRSLSKFLIYETVVILGFVTETYLTGEYFPVSRIIGAFIGITELKSVIENMNEIYGSSIFGVLLKKLGSGNE